MTDEQKFNTLDLFDDADGWIGVPGFIEYQFKNGKMVRVIITDWYGKNVYLNPADQEENTDD